MWYAVCRRATAARSLFTRVLALRPSSHTQVYDYQRTHLSMSCRNPKKALLCEPHAITRINFYGAPMSPGGECGSSRVNV